MRNASRLQFPGNSPWRAGLKLPMLVGLLLLAVLMGLGSCRGCQKEDGRKADDIPPQCGECLDLKTGEVCTQQGTMRNSCLAICMRQKILCSSACPCPEK